MALYREFGSQEEIDAEYDLRHSVEDPEPFREFYRVQGEKARSSLNHELKQPYGPTLAEHLDLFPGPEGAPIVVFIHGGYWRSKSSADYHLVALGPHAAGMAVAVVNYELCPKVRMDEITRQNRAAVAWLWKNAASFGGDRDRMVVVGHSAGAQQVARLLATPWEDDYGLPAHVIKGGLAISGVYDLRPLRYSFLQPKLMLDAETIFRESPIFQLPASAPRLCVSVGAKEPAEFLRQSRDFYEAWRGAGLPGSYFEQPETNHYTAINGLSEPDSALMNEVKALLAV